MITHEKPSSPLTVKEAWAAIDKAIIEAESHQRTALARMKYAGDLLVRLKAKAPHGTWEATIEANCRIKPRMARYLMELSAGWKKLSLGDVETMTLSEALEAIKAAMAAEDAEEEAAATTSSGGTLDEEGHLIPEKCSPAFLASEKFKEMEKHCRDLQTLIDETAKGPGGEELARRVQAHRTKDGEDEKITHHNEHLDALKRDVKFTRPHSICPWCKGEATPECKGCNGHGWITKVTWKDVSEEVKARLNA